MRRPAIAPRPRRLAKAPASCLRVVAGGLLLLVGAATAAFAVSRAAASLPPPEPRPLSAAERQAVLYAAEYLHDGPAAWWPRLASGSPLRRLGREAALEEIEVRAGSPAGATWELQTIPPSAGAGHALFTLELPSGADDTLDLALVEEGGSWKISTLRISTEPVAPRAASPAAAESAAAEPPAARLAAPWGTIGLGALALALVCAAVGFLLRRRPALAIPVGLLGLAALALALLVVVAPGLLRLPGPAAAGSAAAGGEGAAELRSLLPLRRALTQPGEPGAAETVAGDGAAGRVARLWRAQHLLAAGNLSAVPPLLAAFPSPGDVPAAELLRARLEFAHLKGLETAVAYQRALAVSVAHEGLLAEAAQAFSILGFEDHARAYLRQLRDLGARQGETYYALAQYALLDDYPMEAEADFRTAWHLQPLAREDLLGQPFFAYLLLDSQMRKLVALDTPVEPATPCGAAGRPLTLPAGVKAHLAGAMLRLTTGTAELIVPFGCDLAPMDASAETTLDWKKERERAALDRLPELRRGGRAPGALAQPALRREMAEAALALADRQRWAELAELTEALADPASPLPAELTQLRAVALVRSGRPDGVRTARDLLVRLAKGNTAEHRPDPATLFQLADLVARLGDYDVAEKLVAKANAQLPFTPSADRMRRLQMEKRLAQSFETYKTAHFELRYPPERGKGFAVRAAEILEAEQLRLARYIPPAAGAKPIEVHFLPVADFVEGYSQGGEVVGVYDGIIRVPFGEVWRWNPLVVSILTHELAHALIAQRTGDRAPHWLQEGLAQHVQMLQERANPIPAYRAKNTLLAFPLLEPTLAGVSSAEWSGVAYDEALWLLHYVESRYGVAGIHRLLAAFAAGQTTDEAVSSALGTTVPQLDHDAWSWCTTQAPAAWHVTLVRYD